MATVHWPARYSGKTPPGGSVPRVGHSTGKAQGWHDMQREEQRWHRATTTRARSSLFLHYPDQAFNARDDDATSSESAVCQVLIGIIGRWLLEGIDWYYRKMVADHPIKKAWYFIHKRDFCFSRRLLFYWLLHDPSSAWTRAHCSPSRMTGTCSRMPRVRR